MLRYLLRKPTNNLFYYQSKRYFTNNMPSNVKLITGSQLLNHIKENDTKITSDMAIIDVREREEIERDGKIKNSINIPFKLSQDMFTAGLSSLNKHHMMVFHCKSGRRSQEAAKLADKLGFENVYDLEGGLNNWNEPLQPFMDNHSPWVHTIFDTETETAQYIVTDLETKEAFIIDPVLNYDPFSNEVYPLFAKSIIQFVEKYDLKVSKIIDTHVHADHLTAAAYLKQKLPTKPEFWIGSNVTKVQKVFSYTYNLDTNELNPTGEQFDKLITECMSWKLGNIKCSVLATPGHTPACMSYRIGDAAFVGDTLFMPDVGTARCDFPGGSSKQMYESVHKMYKSWPDDTRIFVGHDYPPNDRPYQVVTSLEKHKKFNKMINESVTQEKYEKLRNERDAILRAPRYIHPSIQTNLRGGILPTPEKSVHGNDASHRYFKIPIKTSTL